MLREFFLAGKRSERWYYEDFEILDDLIERVAEVILAHLSGEGIPLDTMSCSEVRCESLELFARHGGVPLVECRVDALSGVSALKSRCLAKIHRS